MKLHNALLILSAALLGLCLAGAGTIPASAQQQDRASAPPAQRSAAQSSPDALPMPVNEIIRRFAARESEFRKERGNYTYSQTLLVQDTELGGGNEGKFELASDIIFTPEGRRYEKVTYAPQPTLRNISLSPEDMRDLENIQPFVLTTEELPKYNVEYAGKERIDALDTYVFQVAPKRIEKDQRYFQGTIWVDDHDLAVVKSEGKAVPDVKGQFFLRFTTYRENIERDMWFPVYTRGEEVVNLGTRDNAYDVRVRMTVRYRNYKRFGSTVRVGESTEVKEPPSNTPPPPRP